MDRCSQEDQKRREADNAIEEANKAQAEADAKRNRAVAKQVRADAETRVNALEDHARAVEKDPGAKPLRDSLSAPRKRWVLPFRPFQLRPSRRAGPVCRRGIR